MTVRLSRSYRRCHRAPVHPPGARGGDAPKRRMPRAVQPVSASRRVGLEARRGAPGDGSASPGSAPKARGIRGDAGTAVENRGAGGRALAQNCCPKRSRSGIRALAEAVFVERGWSAVLRRRRRPRVGKRQKQNAKPVRRLAHASCGLTAAARAARLRTCRNSPTDTKPPQSPSTLARHTEQLPLQRRAVQARPNEPAGQPAEGARNASHMTRSQGSRSVTSPCARGGALCAERAVRP